GSLSDFKTQQTVAARAAQTAAQQGSRLLLARARMEEAVALQGLGDPLKSIEVSGEAQRIYAAAGDSSGVAAALNLIGNAHQLRGELTEARNALEQAVAVYRDIGNRAAVDTTSTNLGIVLQRLGLLAQAMTTYQEALSISRETG